MVPVSDAIVDRSGSKEPTKDIGQDRKDGAPLFAGPHENAVFLSCLQMRVFNILTLRLFLFLQRCFCLVVLFFSNTENPTGLFHPAFP